MTNATKPAANEYTVTAYNLQGCKFPGMPHPYRMTVLDSSGRVVATEQTLVVDLPVGACIPVRNALSALCSVL